MGWAFFFNFSMPRRDGQIYEKRELSLIFTHQCPQDALDLGLGRVFGETTDGGGLSQHAIRIVGIEGALDEPFQEAVNDLRISILGRDDQIVDFN
jgi:hypothetical protein